MTSTKSDIQIAKKNDYINIRELWDDTFKEDSNTWRNWYFEHIYKPENTFLIYKNKELASMAHFNLYPMMLNSKEIKSASLAGVATRIDMRKKGYAEKLIKESLNEMNKRGVAFSFLYPFNYDFYRRYGYELCYENSVYTVQGKPDTDIYCERIDDSSEVDKLYTEFTQKLNGYIIRDSKYQEIKFEEHFADENTALIIKYGKEPIGYALAQEESDKMIIGELICIDIINAAKCVSAYYNKPVEFISPYIHKELMLETKPHCMGRVVDVIGVFDEIPAKDCRIVVNISDDIIKENDDCFLFEAKDGTLKVSRTKDKADIELDIKELSTIAAGYVRGMNGATKAFYNKFFEGKTPWIVEVC